MPNELNISQRVLNEAKRQAAANAMKMETFFQRRLLRSWDDLERNFSIKVDKLFRDMPWSYANFSTFKRVWVNSVEARLIAATSKKKDEATKIRVDHEEITFGSVTLYPEQVGCFKAIRKAFFGPFEPNQRPIRAALQDGYMGSGKSYIGGAILADAIFLQGMLKDPLINLRPHPFLVVTPKGVCEHWKRVLESMGLGDYVANRKIYVFSNGEFLTEVGERFCFEEEDEITGETRLVWNPTLCPIVCILDECHNFIRPGSKRTQKIIQMLKQRQKIVIHNRTIEIPKTLFMSATPMEKVNDARTFAIAVDTDFMGVHVDESSFNNFAKLIDKEPHKPNLAAVTRLRNVLSDYIFSIPYVKPKFKAVNMVWVVDFLTESHKRIYHTAHQRYVEACRKSGKNTAWGRFQIFIELNNYRKTVEPLRAPHLAERAAANFKSGKLATAIGCAFKETVAEVVFQLVDKHGIDRKNISIIWGGKRQYRTEDLLTREEIDNIIKPGVIEKAMFDKALMKRLKITLRYLQDQHEHEESAEQQAHRHERLRELGLLGKQNDNVRQLEIDNFQDGTTKICIFTLASGGVGLSFDRDKDILLPREGLFTPVYNGKEFQQVLGRLVRRASISDANQYICMMKDTVEEYHVAPILDSKLKCIAAITNRNFDIIDLLQRDAPAAAQKLRSFVEAAADAEKDDTIVTDFVAVKDEEEDDEEDEIDKIIDV